MFRRYAIGRETNVLQQKGLTMHIGSWEKMLFAAMATLCCVEGTQGRTVREALDVLLATEYCGEATADGMDLSTALRGESPVSGDGVFDVPQAEWLPVMLEMAGEELEACIRDTAADIAAIRRLEAAGEKRDNSEDEGTMLLWNAHRRVRSRGHKLRKIAECLLFVEGDTGPVLDMLERIGLEIPPEFDLSWRIAISMVRKGCRDGQSARCLEFGRRYRRLHGPGTQQEWNLCRELVGYGLHVIKAETESRECMRYMLEVADTLENVPLRGVSTRWPSGRFPAGLAACSAAGWRLVSPTNQFPVSGIGIPTRKNGSTEKSLKPCCRRC